MDVLTNNIGLAKESNTTSWENLWGAECIYSY